MIAELKTAISNAPSRKDRLKSLTQVETVKLKVERAALLFSGAPIAIGASIVNAMIAAVVAWGSIDQGVLISWTGAVMALAMVRIAVWVKYRLGKNTARNLTQFSKIHIVFMSLNGAMWGALAPIFAFHGFLGNGFLPFIIAGMTAAAIVSAGASWRAVLSFNIPALAPLAVVYALTGGATGFAIAGVVMFYVLATAYLAWSTQRRMDISILLGAKSEQLSSALQRQVDQAHEAEQRFRALVEVSTDVTIIFSPNGLINYASPSVTTAFGVEAASLIGLTTKEIVHPDDMPVFRSVGEKSLSKLGEVMRLDHVCMRGPGGDYAELSGRLTNMLYIPGVEGFVFSGGLVQPGAAEHTHAAE